MENLKLLHAISEDVKLLEEENRTLKLRYQQTMFWNCIHTIASFEKVDFKEIHKRLLAENLINALLSQCSYETKARLLETSLKGELAVMSVTCPELVGSYLDMVRILKLVKF